MQRLGSVLVLVLVVLKVLEINRMHSVHGGKIHRTIGALKQIVRRTIDSELLSMH